MMKNLLSIVAALFTGAAQAEPSFDDTLAALETVLADKRPDYATQLQPPLSANEIEVLEQRFATRLPDEVKALYMWRNGQNPNHSASFVENLMFLPLESLLETKADFDGMIGYDFELENWWHPDWFPVFSNGGGVYLVVDSRGVHTGQKGQLIYFYDDYESRPIVAPNLLTFMNAVLAYYEKTPSEALAEGFDLEGFLPKTGQSFKAEGVAKPLE